VVRQPGPAQRPDEIDLLVVGGGTAGAALAGLVAGSTDLNVVLLEAGPDYGSLSSGAWPPELLDASCLPRTHDWGYAGLAHASHAEPTPFDRARVIGGCSAHNGCVALLGHRLDYDGWAGRGNPGWGWDAVAPAFERAKARLRVRIPERDELPPFQAAFVDAAVAAGIPPVADLNDPDDVSGVAPSPANIFEGIRWNTAFAYLDPVRNRPNLTILDNILVDRVAFEAGQAVAVEAIRDGARLRLPARRIVLAAGAYGSPAILLRSGVGPADEIASLGIRALHDLPGVGRALTDHPTTYFLYRGSAEIDRAMEQFGASRWLPDEQTLLKTPSSHCRGAFDLHLYAVSGYDRAAASWTYSITISTMDPHGAGALRLQSADPAAPPLIDHGYLSDPDGHDAAVLADGVDLARSVAAAVPLAGRLTEMERRGPVPASRGDVVDYIRRTIGIYYHPACTCRMGPASDPSAVVDADGKVHGLEGLYVCDASIFTTILRGNTNLPAAMLAEHLAPRLAAS
jgi:choline dehydrogenase